MFEKILIIIRYLYHLFIVFGFMFQIPLLGPLTTKRLSCLIALWTLILKRKELKSLLSIINKKRLFTSIAIYILLIIQILILSIGVEQKEYSVYIVPWSFLLIMIYIPFFALYTIIEFKDVKYFLYVFIGCFIIQTIAVYGAVINTPFRLLLYDMFYFGDDRFETDIVDGTRIMGITLCGSSGSIVCSTSVVLLTYCYLKKHITPLVYLLFSTLFISMTAFIGRTGQLIELICVCYALFFGNKANRIKNILLITIFASILVFIILQLLDKSDSSSSERLLSWMTGAFRSDTRHGTIDSINYSLPPLSMEFLLGTSVMRGITPYGTKFSSDSGYIMMYGSIGIIGSLLYYAAFLSLYNIGRIRLNNKQIYRFFVIIIIISFLIEYKEPFMLKMTFSYMILVVTLFSLMENNKNVNAINYTKVRN